MPLRLKKQWMVVGCGIAACLALVSPQMARAQPQSDAQQCKSVNNNPDLAIKHCSAAIDSKKFSGGALADLYTSRGVEWSVKGETDRAIADFDASLKLVPGNASVLHARAVELAVRGDYARAITDLDATLKLNPKASGAYFARGRARFYMGDFANAANDIETELKSRPNAYTAIWVYLARARQNPEDAAVQLERDSRRVRGGWPSPVIALYAGSSNVESVIIAARDTDPARDREIRCEANFYIAQWHLIKNEREPGAKLLRAVRDNCAKNLLEYEGTVAELRRLKL
jgi:lipoprotein NlpI